MITALNYLQFMRRTDQQISNLSKCMLTHMVWFEGSPQNQILPILIYDNNNKNTVLEIM